MTTSSVTELQNSGLNNFLFADVGAEANGMMLSVVSVLARQGNDPWREAGLLANLPKDQAVARLAQAIVHMPCGLWDIDQAGAIAARLVDLLPSRSAKSAFDVVQSARPWKQIGLNNVILTGFIVGVGVGLLILFRF